MTDLDEVLRRIALLPADSQRKIFGEMNVPEDQAGRHRRRDEAIRKIARGFLEMSRTNRAKKVAVELVRYRATSWRQDQLLMVLPPTRSELRRALFTVLKNNGGEALAYRQIYEVID